jgi:hypothetical protein
MLPRIRGVAFLWSNPLKRTSWEHSPGTGSQTVGCNVARTLVSAASRLIGARLPNPPGKKVEMSLDPVGNVPAPRPPSAAL